MSNAQIKTVMTCAGFLTWSRFQIIEKKVQVKIWFPSRCCHNLSVYPGPVYYFSFLCLSIPAPRPILLRPHLSHSNFLSSSTAERRQQTTPESRLTDSCCQGTSISRMYISVRKSERTHVYTRANTTAQRWRLPWVISRVSRAVHQFSLQPGERKQFFFNLISAFSASLAGLAFQISSERLWHFTKQWSCMCLILSSSCTFLTKPLWSGLWALPNIKMIISGRKCGTKKKKEGGHV